MMPGTPGGGTSVLLALLVCLFLGAVVYLELSTSLAPEVASEAPTGEDVTQLERLALPPEAALCLYRTRTFPAPCRNWKNCGQP